MLATEVGFPHTELTLVALSELSVTHLDAVGVLTNPADHLSGCEPGFAAMGAHGAGSDHPHRVSHPELLRCRAWGGLLTLSMLLLELLAGVTCRCFLPREEFLGIHGHAITGQGRSPTQGGPCRTESGERTNHPEWGCHDGPSGRATSPQTSSDVDW